MFVESIQGIFYNVQLMPDVFHHAVDAAGVLQDIHTLGVGVVVDCEWTPNGLSKLPADTAKSFVLIAQFNLSHHSNIVATELFNQSLNCRNLKKTSNEKREIQFQDP